MRKSNKKRQNTLKIIPCVKKNNHSKKFSINSTQTLSINLSKLNHNNKLARESKDYTLTLENNKSKQSSKSSGNIKENIIYNNSTFKEEKLI